MARQFKGSVDIEQTFAPTSLMIIPKMMIHLLLNVCAGFVAMTLDIKDAFLMADQPCEERSRIKIEEKVFRQLRYVEMLARTKDIGITVVSDVLRSLQRVQDGTRCDATHAVHEAGKHVSDGACR